MSDEEKMLFMFTAIHGEISGKCYVEVEEDENGDPARVVVMKSGQECWGVNKADLLFDYMTRRW